MSASGPGLIVLTAQEKVAQRLAMNTNPWKRVCSPAPATAAGASRSAPCHYEGKQFTLGESWLSTTCLLCTCLHPVGVGCCEITQHPIDFPDWCMAHYDSQTCQISVVQKANPSLPCVNSMEREWGSAGTPEPMINKVLEMPLSR
ncbi:prostate-associated microseminoprotein isoform X1 [Mauremys mutica]|uniref:prostate-associated microseminoprotein isoform X1 n=1 Tax=Mauremys mutica TaxID=74926 RepID=UPI001D160FF4|nr:prostate-associated microseminoprotein isoform X1 [Mauremys mutica]